MINLEKMGQSAVLAKYELQLLTTEEKNRALKFSAKKLLENKEEILRANALDIQNGKEKGMHPGLLDRLRLDEQRLRAMAKGIMQIIELPDPVGEVMERFQRPNGLDIEKRRVPLGVIGIIYESRPNVTADAFGLCFKAGNAVMLKGGSDAIQSNMAIATALREGLYEAGVTEAALQLIGATDREITKKFMNLKEYVDVLIPRGSAGLIRAVTENSSIPVIETGTGNCHIYVDEHADLAMAAAILKMPKHSGLESAMPANPWWYIKMWQSSFCLWQKKPYRNSMWK